MKERTNILIEEFTTLDPESVKPDDNLDIVQNLMKERGCRHALVVQGQKAVGIISQRDVYRALLQDNAGNLLAKDIMQSDLYRVKYTDTIEEVAFAMSDKKIGSAIVENNSGEVYGIFTTTDALNALVEILRGDVISDLSQNG